ncbi:unnamed protein product [Trifolium pratense]|uniref:Uncharacterized protein n=1 Tax=Trifolium pratense TaxID=57577 RepID=A0ACB0KH97_TRIPR|nr:unnamed protein product [Trifolium pratense]
MVFNKVPLLVVLIFLISSIVEKPLIVEGRTLSLISHHQGHGYSKIFATLGLVCKCCDDVIEGACKETWADSCSNIQCLPWKTH